LPTPRERQVLVDLLDAEQQRFAGDEPGAWQTVANDPANPPKLPEGATPAEAAAWTALCRVLLNLDETITRE
jgi:hypothetical protein